MKKSAGNKNVLLALALFCFFTLQEAGAGEQTTDRPPFKKSELPAVWNPGVVRGSRAQPFAGRQEGENFLAVQYSSQTKKNSIKSKMKYVDKILEEINALLSSQEKASEEVLQKIKRLLLELERLKEERDL